MKPAHVNGVLLGFGVALIVALAIARSERARVTASDFSTYDSGRNGYRALYTVLRREGVAVRRFERPIGLLDARVSTLVLSSNAPERSADIGVGQISAADVARLHAFVLRGGRLVLLGAGSYPELARAFHLTELPQPATQMNTAVAHAISTLVPVAHVALNAGVERVRARVDSLYAFRAQPDAIPLLGNRMGIAALAIRRGKGSVVAIASPYLWSNAEIARADNARFAYAAIEGRGTVAFDERVHGYAVDKSFWAALPPQSHIAVFVALAIVLLWLIGANLRGLPTRVLSRADERDSRAYLDAMAALLRRAGAGAVVIARFCERIESAQLHRLQAVQRPKDRDVLRAAQLYFSLRKDLR